MRKRYLKRRQFWWEEECCFHQKIVECTCAYVEGERVTRMFVFLCWQNDSETCDQWQEHQHTHHFIDWMTSTFCPSLLAKSRDEVLNSFDFPIPWRFSSLPKSSPRTLPCVSEFPPFWPASKSPSDTLLLSHGNSLERAFLYSVYNCLVTVTFCWNFD